MLGQALCVWFCCSPAVVEDAPHAIDTNIGVGTNRLVNVSPEDRAIEHPHNRPQGDHDASMTLTIS